MNRAICRLLRLVILFGLTVSPVLAGMPAVLPTPWIKENPPDWASNSDKSYGLVDARLQAISFFIACLLASAWGVRGLWNSLRRDWSWMPELNYRRSLSVVILWGLLFVIALTMISGARELMTPGAWKKQGWTYKLADPVQSSAEHSSQSAMSPRLDREKALQHLKSELWRYADGHRGHFPDPDTESIDPALYRIPGWPGMRFVLLPRRTREQAGQVLVFEPALNREDPLVLLTNGVIGSMPLSEIRELMVEYP